MNDQKNDEVLSWFGKAKQDLDAASWLLKSPEPFYGVIGFHCQQSAEKSLKAYLTWHEDPFEKTHSLVALVGKCLKFSSDFDILRTSASTLTPYAITTRYPGEMPEITSQEAENALSMAR